MRHVIRGCCWGVVFAGLALLLARSSAAGEMVVVQDGQPRATIIVAKERERHGSLQGHRGNHAAEVLGKVPRSGQAFGCFAALVDETAAEALKKYAVRTRAPPKPPSPASRGGKAVDRSVPYEEGAGSSSRLARKHHCYLIVPLELLEDARSACSNACVVVDRNGETVGVYRKMFPRCNTAPKTWREVRRRGRRRRCSSATSASLACKSALTWSSTRVGRNWPAKGAELVVWPTWSPQTTHPAACAMKHRYYIISRNWAQQLDHFRAHGQPGRSGRRARRACGRNRPELYDSPRSPQLKTGALEEKYGGKVGFRYYEDEDCGFFWSNDPRVTIGEMARSVNMVDWAAEHARLGEVLSQVRPSKQTGHGP